jgi:hypothetical protein
MSHLEKVGKMLPEKQSEGKLIPEKVPGKNLVTSLNGDLKPCSPVLLIPSMIAAGR